jgi:hypothetical protein
MADTPRTLSALLALLADNTSGNITAQVVRDLTVSLYPSRGQLELASGGAVETTFGSSGTYVPVAGTTALDTAVWNIDANGAYTKVSGQCVRSAANSYSGTLLKFGGLWSNITIRGVEIDGQARLEGVKRRRVERRERSEQVAGGREDAPHHTTPSLCATSHVSSTSRIRYSRAVPRSSSLP